MKKYLFVVAIVLLFVACATANAEIMKGYVYEFLNIEPEFKVFEKLEDNELYIENGRMYQWSTSSCLSEEVEGLNFSEIEEFMENTMRELGMPLCDAHVSAAGKDCIWVQMNTMYDLTKVKNVIPERVTEPVYGFDLVCWRDYQHMH